MGKRTAIAGTCLASALLLAGCGGAPKSDTAAPAAGTVSGTAPDISSSSPTPDATSSSSASPSPSTSSSSSSPTTPPTTPSTSATPTKPLQSWKSSLSLAQVSPQDGQTVGVGMPVRVVFNSGVSPADRATVERAMHVTTTPHVDGAWSWLNSTTVDFRPQGYWPAHTQVAVHLALASVDTPDGTRGATTRDFSFRIGDDHESVVDAATHQMVVTENGTVIRTMPTGTGKPGYDTDGGTMVVLGKIPVTTMTSCAIGLSCTPGVGDYYSLVVHYAVQLTLQGIFVHQAEWDSNIGHANTSHGCIHLRPSDAAWFYQFSRVGDPVRVLHTPHPVHLTNGFGDYTLSWSDWLAGSAAGVQAG